MLKKENYFGMYLGQPYCWKNENVAKLGNFTIEDYDVCDDDFCKLILRPYESMTEEEIKEILRMYLSLDFKTTDIGCCKLLEYEFYHSGLQYLKIRFINGSIPTRRKMREDIRNICLSDMRTNIFEYLISIGIDVFNLKQKGFAVYESDLKGEN